MGDWVFYGNAPSESRVSRMRKLQSRRLIRGDMVIGRQMASEKASLYEEEDEGCEKKEGSGSTRVAGCFSGVLLRHGAWSA